jgi:hypothetical protein
MSDDFMLKKAIRQNLPATDIVDDEVPFPVF